MSWLTDFNNAKDKANAVSWYLLELSELLFQVGNEQLSTKINRMHIDLHNALEEMQKAINENFNEQVKRSEESTANIIKACLARGKMNSNPDFDEEGFE
jgi:hypothetical protein